MELSRKVQRVLSKELIEELQCLQITRLLSYSLVIHFSLTLENYRKVITVVLVKSWKIQMPMKNQLVLNVYAIGGMKVVDQLIHFSLHESQLHFFVYVVAADGEGRMAIPPNLSHLNSSIESFTHQSADVNSSQTEHYDDSSVQPVDGIRANGGRHC